MQGSEPEVRVSPTIGEIAERFAFEARRVFPDGEIFLFGSQAHGTADEGSDVDMAVIIDDFPGSEGGFWARMKVKRPLVFMAADLTLEYDIPVEVHFFVRSQNVGPLMDTVLRTGIRIDESFRKSSVSD